jgi:quinolinate synthase
MTDFEKIVQAKKDLGSRMAILAHHYQRDEVVRHADIVGDSLELAGKIEHLSAEFIIFCGVSFMAETAAVLAGSGQKVFLPDKDANCVMAETAPWNLVSEVIRRLESDGHKIRPLAYVNSNLGVKALCGAGQGSVCTSANAATMLEWALGKNRSVLFLPDKNLGLNTARKLGLDPDMIRTLDVRGRGKHVSPDSGTKPLCYLWPGMCAVHYRFRPEDVRLARKRHPRARVIVHPECSPEVVALSDGAGSTSYIIKEIAGYPHGTTVYVGTESHLVHRLADTYRGRLQIFPLRESQCSNMARITEAELAYTIANLQSEAPVQVDALMADQARQALKTMLQVCFNAGGK